jgi:hypothetical protein
VLYPQAWSWPSIVKRSLPNEHSPDVHPARGSTVPSFGASLPIASSTISLPRTTSVPRGTRTVEPVAVNADEL